MRHNIQRLLSVLTLSIILTFPLKGWAQESVSHDILSADNQSTQIGQNYLWRRLQFTYAMGSIMYGNNIVNSCVNQLRHVDKSYAMGGVMLSVDLKYNIFEHNNWSLYLGVGYTHYSQSFKNDYVLFNENGSIGTFISTNDTNLIARLESKQPSDFGLEHKNWDSTFSMSYLIFPVSISRKTNNVEYGFTLLPSVRVGNTSLRRDISISSGEDDYVLYECNDNRLDNYINNFGCNLRFSCLYKGLIGGYVEFGTMSLTKNLKHGIYSFTIGVQFQLSLKE